MQLASAATKPHSELTTMANQQRLISLHSSGEKDQRVTRFIHSQTLGQNIEPFVSLELYSAQHTVPVNGNVMTPDRGRAIITLITAGEAVYRDSLGKHFTLKKNDVLWILSGAGISYSLTPTTQDCISLTLVTALSPSLKHAPAQSDYLAANLVEQYGPAHIFLGGYKDARGGFALPALINYLKVSLTAGQSWTYEPPINHSLAWIAVINGNLNSCGSRVAQEEMVIYEHSNKSITFFAEKNSTFLIGSSVNFSQNLAVNNTARAGVREKETV